MEMLEELANEDSSLSGSLSSVSDLSEEEIKEEELEKSSKAEVSKTTGLSLKKNTSATPRSRKKRILAMSATG